MGKGFEIEETLLLHTSDFKVQIQIHPLLQYT